MNNLSHIDENGNAIMVDVSEKDETKRTAIATGIISMKEETFDVITSGTAKKGDVLGSARIAGIIATKKTPELIPLCHPLMLEKSTIDFNLDDKKFQIEVKCTVSLTGKTGVEMEALTGVSIALLTIYDMCKAIDRGMEIKSICLFEKRGGKSGVYNKSETK